MHWSGLERLLELALSRPLPGHAAQGRLSPRPRVGWEPGHVPDDARAGAALLLLYPDAQAEAMLVLTLREAGLSKHAGQVSLPGGAAEAGESLVEAALRETREEIGVPPEQVRILGGLSPLFIPVSGFALHPFVGTVDRRPGLARDPREVARILEVPLRAVLDASNLGVVQREFRGRAYEVPYLAVDGERVWGATAMILAEFLALLEYRPDPWREHG